MIYITVGHVSLSFVLLKSKIEEEKKEKKPVCLVDSSSQSFLVFSHVDATKRRRNKLLCSTPQQRRMNPLPESFFFFSILFHAASRMNGGHLQFGDHDYYQSCIQAIRFASPFTIKKLCIWFGMRNRSYLLNDAITPKWQTCEIGLWLRTVLFIISSFIVSKLFVVCCCLLYKSLWFIHSQRNNR